MMKRSNLIALFLITPLILGVQKVNAQALNFYYGTLHAHSSYSDGNKDSSVSMASTPYDNFEFAKTAQHFDFLGISEHNHHVAGMVLADYAKGLQQADSANQDGIFVTMYGMEWGVIGPPGGHVLIYGMDQLIGWDSISGIPNFDIFNAKSDYAGLFTLLARTPGAFASLAHPEPSDYSNLFTNPVNTTSDSAIVATAIRSGPAFSRDTIYGNPSTSSFEIRYKDALKRGYHLGAVLDHDNHYTTFGKMAESRTVVLASSLTRDTIMEAIRQRRVQASDDWNVQVTFKINNRPLGSIFTDTVSPFITVAVYDPDLETTSNISIVYGVPGSGTAPTTLTSSTTGSLSYTHTTAFGSTYYYYAVVTQADGDKIFTAPIWVSKMTVLPVKLVSFSASRQSTKIKCEWTTASEWNASFFELEKSADGYSFTVINKQTCTNSSIVKHYVYEYNQPSLNTVYYRLKQVDIDGAVNYSNIISVNGIQNQQRDFSVSPNPFESTITIDFNETIQSPVAVTILNTMGAVVLNETFPQLGEEYLRMTIPENLPAGIYTIQVQNNQQRFSKHIIKIK